jgi:septal ring factor EnvC (AmiA/AmiB activator)
MTYWRIIHLHALGLALWALSGAALADEIGERQQQLDAIKAELEVRRARFDSLGRKEKNELSKLRDLEQQTALSSQLLLIVGKELQRLKSDIASQRLRLEITSLQLDDRKGTLARRLRYIYKVGDASGLLEILSSGDPTSAVVAFRNMEALVKYDQHLIEMYHKLSKDLESGLEKYRRDMTSVQKLQWEQEDELQKREKMLRSRKGLVERLKRDKSEVQKSIQRLEEDAKEIAGILEELESQGRLAEEDSSLVGLATSRGDLIWPVQGRIFRKFGTAKDKRGIVLSNPGIDIQAKFGTDVQSAAPGTVIYTSWLRGYGQFIIIDHGKGYYTLYANLSDILVEVGDRVKGGELIALVGDSGSLEGPKLHFEVRHRKEQLDPMDWLR